jgi:hypothetical protein
MIARAMALTQLEVDVEYVRRTTVPSASGTIYRSERFWPVSRIWPFLRPVLPTQEQWDRDAWWNSWRKGELPVKEHVHWTVAERFGHKAPVEGRGEECYTPRNVPNGVFASHIAPMTPEERLLRKDC